MVQVRPSSRVCAFRADLTCLQLAASSRLVSSRGLCRSLRHACHLVSHRIRCLGHCSGASNRPRRLSISPARPYGLPAFYLDVARSYRRRARSGRCWDLSKRIRRPRQPLRGPDRPRRLSTPLATPKSLLGLELDSARSYRRRAASRGPGDLPVCYGDCWMRPLRRPAPSAGLEAP